MGEIEDGFGAELLHLPEVQSVSLLHVMKSSHVSHEPPQSVSVSEPSFLLLKQPVLTHCRAFDSPVVVGLGVG